MLETHWNGLGDVGEMLGKFRGGAIGKTSNTWKALRNSFKSQYNLGKYNVVFNFKYQK